MTESNMMKAGILDSSRRFSIQDWQVPSVGPDEVLLRVHACGVCMSEVSWWELGDSAKDYPLEEEDVLDWELQKRDSPTPKASQFPILMGHEPGGEIVAVGANVSHLKPGMRAVSLGSQGFAEYCTCKADYVHPIQDSTAFTHALGEPIACAFNAARRIDLQPGEKVVLVGCGFMGLMLLQILKLANPGVIVAIDVRDDVLELARTFGADVIINSARDDVLAAVRRAVGPKGADVVVEAVGHQIGLDIATQIVGWYGRIAIYGYHQGEPRRIDVGAWNAKAITVINAHERYHSRYFEGMVGGISLLEAGQLNMEPLVTHVYPLEKLDDAFHDAARKPAGFIKAVVTI